jgi:hypothetical protein
VRPQGYRNVLTQSHLPLSFAVILGGGFFLGLKADEWLETRQPICAFLGVLLGFAGGFYYLWVSLYGRKGAPDSDEPEEKRTDAERPSDS